ncbi:MAG: DUF5119 domain-containing protein [Bacteroidia bacterium]|nr:DUF5119 domain-containing protein [Bacteroidia bacterium]
MKQVRFIFLVGLILLSTGCDFSEVCHYKGDVRVSFDWKRLVQGDSAPSKMETIFYSDENSPQAFSVSGDTTLREISAGQQHAITFNHLPNITFQGMEKMETAQLCLSTYMEKETLHTVQAPMIYLNKQELKVEPYDTTVCHFVPMPGIQQVNFEFAIIQEADIGSPVSLSGELSGVATTYSLSQMKAVRSSAILEFSTEKKAENEFWKNIRVLGLNPSTADGEAISKILSVSLTLNDGHIYTSELDLTRKFENFLSGVLTCRIEIHISSQGMSMQVADWETRDWGDIHIR